MSVSHVSVVSESSMTAERRLAERHAGRKTPYRLDDTEILSRQRRTESNARSYPRRLPIALARGQGVYVEDTEGRVFIDCLAAAGTLALGHGHPAVVEAIESALRAGVPLQTLDLTTPLKDAFVAELLALLPPGFAERARVQFCGPTGSDAVEAAVKLVRTATGRKGIWAFHGAYHGMSQGSLALMGNLGPKAALDGVFGPVQFLPYPYSYRCPFGLGGKAGEAASVAYLENLVEDPESGVLPPAGIVLEPVQGEGGVIPAPREWLRELRRIASAKRIPLILDEVQTGFGRTGRMFAFEHADVVPDVLVVSKAIGGGLPLSLIVYDEALDRWQPGAHAGTFRGNQLAMAAGRAALAVIREQRLDVAAERLGLRLRSGLAALAGAFPCIGEVRGAGLMVGMEIVDRAGPPGRLGHPPASGELARAIQRACLERGLILEVGGRYGATLRFLPPLVIAAHEIDIVVDIVRQALSVVRAPEPRGAADRARA